MIRIHPIPGNKKQYLDLLLLADEEKGIALVPSESLDTPAALFALGKEVSRNDGNSDGPESV